MPVKINYSFLKSYRQRNIRLAIYIDGRWDKKYILICVIINICMLPVELVHLPTSDQKRLKVSLA